MPWMKFGPATKMLNYRHWTWMLYVFVEILTDFCLVTERSGSNCSRWVDKIHSNYNSLQTRTKCQWKVWFFEESSIFRILTMHNFQHIQKSKRICVLNLDSNNNVELETEALKVRSKLHNFGILRFKLRLEIGVSQEKNNCKIGLSFCPGKINLGIMPGQNGQNTDIMPNI